MIVGRSFADTFAVYCRLIVNTEPRSFAAHAPLHARAGAVEDYSQAKKDKIAEVVADSAGPSVDAEDVEVLVTAGSVVITTVIALLEAEADTTVDALTSGALRLRP